MFRRKRDEALAALERQTARNLADQIEYQAKHIQRLEERINVAGIPRLRCTSTAAIKVDEELRTARCVLDRDERLLTKDAYGVKIHDFHGHEHIYKEI